jgi:uncharacterized protein YjlB
MKVKEAPISPPELLNPPRVLAHVLKDDGSIPNSDLPLLLYEGALNLPERNAAVVLIERLLEVNHWGGSWRNGIYPYHHYHSTTHEALAVFDGTARVQFGGERGITQTVRIGDVVIIPAGVAHKNLGGSVDFAVVGAYPAGRHYDMCYGIASERPQADETIAQVPLPEADPIYGKNGPLFEHWRA